MPEDKTYNSSDEKQVAHAKRVAHNDIQAEIKDLRATMKSSSGRNTIWRLLAKCGVYQPCFNQNDNVMSFKEGKRDIGLQYLTLLIEHCHDDYLKMQKEQHERANK